MDNTYFLFHSFETFLLKSRMEHYKPLFTDSYDPLKAGSIDGTDEIPHDKAIWRAMKAKFRPKKSLSGDPECTIFISRLNPNTTEHTLRETFQDFGDVCEVTIVRDVVTGFSKCYAFLEFESSYQARSAIRSGNKMVVDDHEVLVDSEKERLLKGWIPRRLGGGLGGKRESGQLRFGGHDRPFSKPILRPELRNKTVDKQTEHRTESSSYSKRKYSEHQRNRRRSRSRDRHRSRSRSRHRSRNRVWNRSRSRDRSRSSSRNRKRKNRSRSRSSDRTSSRNKSKKSSRR